jgi:CheY-like chemotaxis protein
LSPLLFVDDNQLLIELLSEAARMLGYPSIVASSADNALELLESLPEPPRFALVDVNMGGMTGFDFVRAVRQHPRLHDMHIILTSGSPQEDETPALESGANGYLAKPYGLDTVFMLIEGLE